MPCRLCSSQRENITELEHLPLLKGSKFGLDGLTTAAEELLDKLNKTINVPLPAFPGGNVSSGQGATWNVPPSKPESS